MARKKPLVEGSPISYKSAWLEEVPWFVLLALNNINKNKS